jgi:integrase
LPEKAIELIEEALALRPNQKLEHVFPSPRWRIEDAGFRTDSIYHAMIDLITAAKIKHATPHVLRRTGSTALTSERIGVQPFIRSKILGHRSDAGGGAAVSMKHYDANEYIADKREALTLWQDLVLEIVGERPMPRKGRASTAALKKGITQPRPTRAGHRRRAAA